VTDPNMIPVALSCGHVLQDVACYQMPARGSGDPELVECPEGCGFVEYVLPPAYQGKFTGENIVIIDLGYLEAGTEVEIEVEE